MVIKFPVYQPYLSGNEKKYVNECLETTWISSKGKFIKEFESKFADYLGCKYSTSVSNGTIALHVALLALGIGKGDEVIVPTFTYIASVNSITYTGAKPVFVDSNPVHWQMDNADITKKVTKRTKAILAVHLYGHPCEISDIRKIANDHNLYLIEDCAEALGSKYDGRKVGTFGHIATFSFYGNKTITTGEGGMVVTNNEEIYKMCVHLKGQGLALNREYWHDIIGYNYRMTNICAAIGLAQLEKIEAIIKVKRGIASWYKEGLRDMPLIFYEALDKRFYSTYWMNCILVKEAKLRDPLRKHLTERGIETRPTFYPIHTMPMYFKKKEKFPIAEDISARGINLPSYPNLSKNDVLYICKAIKEFYEEK